MGSVWERKQSQAPLVRAWLQLLASALAWRLSQSCWLEVPEPDGWRGCLTSSDRGHFLFTTSQPLVGLAVTSCFVGLAVSLLLKLLSVQPHSLWIQQELNPPFPLPSGVEAEL